jgi:hypothetical protein
MIKISNKIVQGDKVNITGTYNNELFEMHYNINSYTDYEIKGDFDEYEKASIADTCGFRAYYILQDIHDKNDICVMWVDMIKQCLGIDMRKTKVVEKGIISLDKNLLREIFQRQREYKLKNKISA